MTFAGSTADGTPNMLACTQTLKQQQNAQNSEKINENIQLSHIRRSKKTIWGSERKKRKVSSHVQSVCVPTWPFDAACVKTR